MRCPKCQSEFDTLVYENVEIDRCTECGGIWFDAQEMEQLAHLNGAHRIDVGDKRVGRQHNETRNIRCPKCRTQMLTMVDGIQTHIEFECCPACLGTFLDAGEFADLTDLTVLERLKTMIDGLLAVR